MDDLGTTEKASLPNSITIPVSGELKEFVTSVAAELHMTEPEAVQELLFVMMYLRRILLVGIQQPQPQVEPIIAETPSRQEVSRSKIDRIGLITALAFGLGALLAVVYVLLTKR